MTTDSADILSMLSPRTVAVVGASGNYNSFGERSVRYFDKLGFQGNVYCVNPAYSVLGKRPCYPSISDIPENIDAAVVTVRKSAIIPAIEELGKKGCRLAVVLTAGFSESGAEGTALQNELLDCARANGIRLIGPNTNGIVNLIERVPLGVCSFMERPLVRPGNLALISQSGSLGASLADLALDAGVGLSYFFSIGNAADIGASELLRALAKDQRTEVIYALLEGSDGAVLFDAISEVVGSGKKLVLTKVGRSTQGRSLASTHSGSIAGSWDAFRAIAEERGAIVAETPELALATCAFASRTTWRSAKPRIQVLTLSGALSGLIADEASGLGLELSEPVDAKTREGLAQLGYVHPLNPLDFGQVPRGENAKHDIGTICDLLLSDSGVEMLLVATGLTHHFSTLAGIMKEMRQKHSKPICAYVMGGEIASAFAAELEAADLYAYRDLRQAMVAIKLGSSPIEARSPAAESGSRQPAHPDLLAAAADSPTEAAIATFLQAYGVPYPRNIRVGTKQEAISAANEISYPVVLKVVGSKILHKSAAGLMRLPVTSDQEMAAAYDDCRQAAEKIGVWEQQMLVQELVDLKGGIEILLAVRRDVEAGPVIVVGPGGIATEAFSGAIVAPIPQTTQDIDRLISRSALLRLLFNRKEFARQRAAFDSAVLSFAAAAREGLSRLETIEVNPLVLLTNERGCIALDASAVVASV